MLEKISILQGRVSQEKGQHKLTMLSFQILTIDPFQKSIGYFSGEKVRPFYICKSKFGSFYSTLFVPKN